jgi:hypothetical protein
MFVCTNCVAETGGYMVMIVRLLKGCCGIGTVLWFRGKRNSSEIRASRAAS